jgi:SAGA-associated factor 29
MSEIQQQTNQPSQTTSTKGRRVSSGKMTHSRSYPRGVGLDFKKLPGLTLMSYIDHHSVPVRNEAPPSEIAVAVARHFEAMEVDEEIVINGFLSRLSAGRELGPLVPHSHSTQHQHRMDLIPVHEYDRYAASSADYARSTAFFDGHAPGPLARRRRRSKNAARPSEQVAAKITRTNENGSWILASVQRFYVESETYDVQDEDDTSKLIRLPWTHVMRLSTGTEGCFSKGTKVMAIFPETTSFYRAIVSKDPVWKLPKGTTTPVVKEIILKFEDDEDAEGHTPHRRVPSRYVIPLPEAYFHEDDDDVDLVPIAFNSA